jgi:penicillin-binding protein 1A
VLGKRRICLAGGVAAQSLALALGASEVRPVELVNAYATFAAGGTWAAPRFLRRIVGPDGRDVPLPALPEASLAADLAPLAPGSIARMVAELERAAEAG